MTIALRHAWLQKHPSPAATRGEFHWYPPDGDRELRASFVERSRGLEAPAVLWQLAPGRVSWARVFAATAPDDGRRYLGLVLATAEDEAATAAELLEALAVPEAAPWSEAVEAGSALGAAASATSASAVSVEVASVAPASAASAVVPAASPARAAESAIDRRLARARRWSAREAAAAAAGGEAESAREPAAPRERPLAVLAREDEARLERRPDAGAPADVAAIARSLLGGGDAVLANPERADLPRLAAAVERWLPPSVAATPRRGAWRAGASQAPDRIAALIAAAWSDPRSRAAQAWALLCELAEARERTVDELAGELAAFERPAAALTDAERAVVGEPRDFAATLHAWGRGRLDESASAATLPSRLADALALRVLACLIADRDPRGPIAEARWHALLPAARRAVLLDSVVRRAASLRALVEVHDA